MATTKETFEVHSAARGPHWISWISRPGSDQPHRSIVLIGETQEEAEARARDWTESPYNAEAGEVKTR